MPRVTAIRPGLRGQVAVELDGVPWRTLPVDVAARSGLSEGRVLDRPALRELRRELRRSAALSVATRALRTRDLSRQALGDRLRASVDATAAEAALETLERAGLVDDARSARSRAESLAARGYGDGAIRLDLLCRSFDDEVVRSSVEALEPELERALQLVERRGASPKTARFLAGKGFDEETVESALGARFANDP
ncbi:MAG TPA: RecX family transcriptional regulator [Gaiellaceae bacterium]